MQQMFPPIVLLR